MVGRFINQINLPTLSLLLYPVGLLRSSTAFFSSLLLAMSLFYKNLVALGGPMEDLLLQGSKKVCFTSVSHMVDLSGFIR